MPPPAAQPAPSAPRPDPRVFALARALARLAAKEDAARPESPK